LKAIIELLSQLSGLARYLVLVALAGGSWWAAEYFSPPPESTRRPPAGKVDYYSKGLERMVMDVNGKPKELLVVEELVHYEGDNHSDLTRPVMTLFVEKGPPWIIEGEIATVPGDEDLVLLHGNVLVTREANEQGRTMRIETTNARVQPERKYAETDEDIVVTSPPDTMTGTGATVTFGDDLHYTVRANARRRHDVQN
jgi:lipopolysaccharide export system protein LptC